MNDTGLLAKGVSWRDYLELCKPNVVGLMLVTSVIGMMLSTKDAVPLVTLIFGHLGIAFCAASAAIVNHVVDRHVDDKMARTVGRPVADGRIKPLQAIMFSAFVGCCGVAILHILSLIHI